MEKVWSDNGCKPTEFKKVWKLGSSLLLLTKISS